MINFFIVSLALSYDLGLCCWLYFYPFYVNFVVVVVYCLAVVLVTRGVLDLLSDWLLLWCWSLRLFTYFECG